MNSLLQALLVAAWGGLCALDQYGPHLGFRKPLLASVGVGLIMNDLQTAIIIGATLELMWLGVNNIGAYIPPDVISGTVVGAALGIASGGDIATATATAVAVAVPVSILSQQINMFIMTTNITLVHKADDVAKTGDFDGLGKLHFTGGVMFFLSRAVPVFLAVYLGSAFVEQLLAAIPTSILDGFSVASKIIPAVGLAMLLTLMMKDLMWIFLILGFVATAYLELPLIAVALIGIAFAGIFDLIKEIEYKNDKRSESSTVEDGGYDL